MCPRSTYVTPTKWMILQANIVHINPDEDAFGNPFLSLCAWNPLSAEVPYLAVGSRYDHECSSQKVPFVSIYDLEGRLIGKDSSQDLRERCRWSASVLSHDNVHQRLLVGHSEGLKVYDLRHFCGHGQARAQASSGLQLYFRHRKVVTVQPNPSHSHQLLVTSLLSSSSSSSSGATSTATVIDTRMDQRLLHEVTCQGEITSSTWKPVSSSISSSSYNSLSSCFVLGLAGGDSTSRQTGRAGLAFYSLNDLVHKERKLSTTSFVPPFASVPSSHDIADVMFSLNGNRIVAALGDPANFSSPLQQQSSKAKLMRIWDVTPQGRLLEQTHLTNQITNCESSRGLTTGNSNFVRALKLFGTPKGDLFMFTNLEAVAIYKHVFPVEKMGCRDKKSFPFESCLIR